MVAQIVLLVCLAVGVSDSARILALVPYNAKSHFMVMEPWLEELAARGHQVTVYSPFPKQSPPPNYTDVDIGKPLERKTYSIEVIREKMGNPWKMIKFVEDMYHYVCELIKEPTFQNILKNKIQYDLLVTEQLGTHCVTYFAYKLKVPLISYTTTVAVPWSSEIMGIPDNPSYIPNNFVPLTPRMTLLERTYNTLIILYAKVLHGWMIPSQHQKMAEEAFGEPLPPILEVAANTSLLLVNSYHTLTQSRPWPPNVIEVAGIHIRERKPLPKDLKNILDGAKNGVLVVSFGSMVQTTSLPKSMINMLLKVFSKLPQTVLFKSDEDLPTTPENVIARKWFPQRDILEHENVVAFFGHGGLASTIETVYFNKPFLGIPFFGDQPTNIKYITQKGAGIELDFDSLTEEKLASAIQEITTNPKYKENMRRLSQQFRDRPMTALQTAVYWTEYVIKHKGAPHLRPASVDLPLYQYLLLDVIALLTITFALSLCIVYIICKLAFNLIRKKNNNKIRQKKD